MKNTFEKEETYEKVKKSSSLTKELFEQTYRQPVTDFEWFDPANALKVTIRRAIPSGSPGDFDQLGSQQHVPLLYIEIRLEDEEET